jgi:pimeloyl-ACP methyl ester carboxylesterase
MAFLPSERRSIPVEDGETTGPGRSEELVYYVYRPKTALRGSCLAVHGVTSTSRAWQFFARTMVEQHSIAVYALDLRGRGDSNGIMGKFGLRQHAADCIKVMDHAQLEKVDWAVGHSMGAFVVATLCHVAPTRVEKNVFLDGGVPLPLPAEFTVETIVPHILGPALKRLSMTFSKEGYIEFFQKHPAFIKGWSPELDEYCRYDLHVDKPSTNPRSVEEDTRDLFGEGIVHDAIALMDRDVLLIRAERGLQNEPVPLYPHEYIVSILHEKYPRIKLKTLADTNHYDILLSQEGADGCIALMLDFDFAKP